MAYLAKHDLLIGDFVLTKLAADRSPRLAMIATDPRRQLSERVEAARSADAMSVALGQPRPPDALVAFCTAMSLRPECLAAGLDYDQIVRSEKAAKGFYIEGKCAPSEGVELLSDQEASSKREAAIMRLVNANAVLTSLKPGLPELMVELCFARKTPALLDRHKLADGLVLLAHHLGKIDVGINYGRPI